MSTKFTVDQVDAGDFREILQIGNTVTDKGKLYYLATGGGWSFTNATNNTAGSKELLGIALGTNSTSDGMLVRGRCTPAEVFGTKNPGIPLFMKAQNGELDVTAPNLSGNIVRVLGYCIDNTGDVYFNPSRDWIEL